MPVALGQPIRGALVGCSADHLGELGLDEGLVDRLGGLWRMRSSTSAAVSASRGQGSRGVTVARHSLTVTGGTDLREPTHHPEHVKTTLG
jgi:hypothetical protein